MTALDPVASRSPDRTTIAATPGTSSSLSHGKSCRSDTKNGHIRDDQRDLVLPKRWIAEATLGWFSRNRRMIKDLETLTANATSYILIARIELMTSRSARP